MKNAIKKISAIAMTFTLLGTGAAATDIGSSKAGNTVAASAAEDVTLKFVDVNGTDAFVYAVQYVYSRNIMSGTSDNTFSPTMIMTRAQFVTALYNMAGRPSVNYRPVFNDVRKGQWYTSAVIWAYDNNITSGIGGNKFGTDQKISREQSAAMLYKYDLLNESASKNNTDGKVFETFKDKNSVSPWAKDAMKWAADKKIICGKREDSKLAPQDKVSRAECAEIVKKYFESKTAPFIFIEV